MAAALGAPARFLRSIAGGDVNQASLLDVDGVPVFLKWNDAAPPTMFACEAEGLRALRDAHALPVPRVLAIGPDFLALEYVPSTQASATFDEELGEGLAALHRVRGLRYGFHQDNFLGRVPQTNAWAENWVAFFAHRRLQPLTRRALDGGHIGADTAQALGALERGLGRWLPAAPAPSRLHGDLWSGNVISGPDGPLLVDPAVFHGHREVDLAMTELFGGFSPRFFAAYRAAWPLDDGYERRRDVYQLVPLLVHVIQFGGPYEHQLRASLARLR